MQFTLKINYSLWCPSERTIALYMYSSQRVSLKSLGFGEVSSRMQDGTAALIDVRPASDFAAYHIPGSLSVPMFR